MGTLIPLAPGLAALGRGDLPQLASDLRTAFAATVIGLLAGTVAFALTLTRTRIYSEDLTALERAAAAMGTKPPPPVPTPREKKRERAEKERAEKEKQKAEKEKADRRRPARRRSRTRRSRRRPSRRGRVSRVGLGRHGRLDDSAGDPLDGLVNLFDLGIVLAVAFLVAGLSLTVNSNTGRVVKRQQAPQDAPAQRTQGRQLPDPAKAPEARGRGEAVGPGLPHARRPPDLRREIGAKNSHPWPFLNVNGPTLDARVLQRRQRRPRSARAPARTGAAAPASRPGARDPRRRSKPGPSVAISNSTPLGSRK